MRRTCIKPAIDRIVGSYREFSEGSMEEYICKGIEHVYEKYFIMSMEDMQNVLMPLNDVGRRSWEAERKRRKEYQSKIDDKVKDDGEEQFTDVEIVEVRGGLPHSLSLRKKQALMYKAGMPFDLTSWHGLRTWFML